MRFRDRLQRFMMGRYGNDQLNKFILAVSFIILIVSAITKIGYLYILAVLLLVLTYIRMFSRNINKRYNENAKFMKIFGKVTGWFKIKGKHLKESKDYRFFSCPTCKQKVRVPKGRGLIEITCPKCKNHFQKRS